MAGPDLSTLKFKTETGENLITNGLLKGMEDNRLTREEIGNLEGPNLFDLNSDGEIDDYEWDFFSTGGSLYEKGDNDISYNDLYKILVEDQKLDILGSNYQNFETDGIVSDEEREKLHKVIRSAHRIDENLGELEQQNGVEGVREAYQQEMDRVNIIFNSGGGEGFGFFVPESNFLFLSDKALENDGSLDLALVHELTHSIQFNTEGISQMSDLELEAQAFYMETLYSQTAGITDPWNPGMAEYLDEHENDGISREELAERMLRTNESLMEWYRNYNELSDEDDPFAGLNFVNIGGMSFRPDEHQYPMSSTIG